MLHNRRRHNTFTRRITSSLPRPRPTTKIRPNNKLIRRRRIKPTSRYHHRIRTTTRTPQMNLSNTTHHINRTRLTRRLVDTLFHQLLNRTMRPTRRVRILPPNRILISHYMLPKRPSNTTCLLQLLSRVRSNSPNHPSIKTRRYNRSARHNNLPHPIQTRRTRRHSLQRLRIRPIRNACLTQATLHPMSLSRTLNLGNANRKTSPGKRP